MPQPIQVGGHISWWHNFWRVVAALGVVLGLILLFQNNPNNVTAGWVIWPVSLACVLGLEGIALVQFLRGIWVEDLGTGLTIRTRWGGIQLADEQVLASAFEIKKNHNQGELESVTRTFRIWTSERPQGFSFVSRYKVALPDPLQALIGRLQTNLVAGYNLALDHGQTVSGEGWQLDKARFTSGSGAKAVILPLEQISAVEDYDDQMCVWQQGQEQPIARIPTKSRNAYLLPQLILPRLPEKSSAAQSSSPAEQNANFLGRILFERKTSRGMIVLLVFVALLMVFSAISFLIGSFAQVRDAQTYFLVALALFFGFVCSAIAAIALPYSAFRCQEAGVFKKNIFGEKRLRYTDVTSFTYSSVRHFHNGVYTGTYFSLRFVAANNPGSPAINHSWQSQGNDEALDDLRDFISRVMAAKMLEALQAGHVVPWTRGLTFRPEGLEYTPTTFFGGAKGNLLLLYTDYGGFNFNQGFFYLFQTDQNKPVYNVATSEPNFYPGYFVLLALKHS